MNSKLIKRFSLVLALTMVVCLTFSACGKTTGDLSDDSDTDVVYEYEYVDENGNTVTTTDPEKAGTTSKKSTTSSKKATTSKKATGSGKTTFESDPYSDIPASLKGTTVKVLLWRTPEPSELELKAAFEARTGIKVEYISTANNETEYQSKLATMISSGESPDVVMMSSGTFPSYAIGSLQSLDSEIFRLDDKCWNKSFMDTYKIGSKYYGLAIAGSWYCDDTSYLTYYIPANLKNLGVSTMPYDLWKAGKWNTDNMIAIARQVASKGSSYHGLSIQTNTIPNPYMLSAGTDFIKYDGKEFSSNMDDATVLSSYKALTQWYADGLVEGWDSAGLTAGTVGLFDAIAYGTNFNANWFTGQTANVNVVPIAGTHVPANPKLWCIPKGAKNVEAAAYFLRFFLDPSNLDMAKTFCNSEQYEVWQYITAASTPKTVNISRGAIAYYDTSTFGTMTTKLANTKPDQINTPLAEFDRTIKAACKRANTGLKKAS